MSLLGEIQTKSLHTHRDFYHGCCKLGHVIGPLNTFTKSQKFLKSTQELIYPKEILSGSWWLCLRHSGGKWVPQRKGFSTSCSHLYSIHVQRGVSDFPPVQNVSNRMEQSGTEDCWVQSGVETGKGLTANYRQARAEQHHWQSSPSCTKSLYLLPPKGWGLANDHW